MPEVFFVFELIGNTPLLEIPHPKARILAKWEGRNLTGSSKDRAARAMLEAAALPPGSGVIEATSGNTGISLAALAAAMGYRCLIVMPENMSRERMDRMRAYGAQVLLTPADQSMAGAVKLAKSLAEDGGWFYVNQFENPANPLAHYLGTGPEIWRDTQGKADIFVAGVGTGGTVSGAGRFLKEQDSNVRIVAVHPAEGELIPGLGAGFLPKNLDLALINSHIRITAADAAGAAKELIFSHGLLAGPSSGAALFAAWMLADRPENRGKTIVTLLPDTGCRYLSGR